jgi:alpha-beta hydrolase superfamily lysophospholipase
MRISQHGKGTAGSFDFEAMRCLGVASAGGAGVGECLAAVGRIRRNDVESWTAEFGALAELLEREAARSSRAGDDVSAAEQYRRASTYYRVGAFFAPGKDPRRHRYRRSSRQTFHRALQASPDRTEIVTIPFAGATLPGYFVSAADAPNPTLLVLGGFDSTAEELMLWLGNACGVRGWNALVFEGPGQPGALDMNPGLVFRPDYEAPVGAAVDYALSRSDVDPQRLAIIGYSFGGYLAPRAAACDPRIRAVIANTIAVDVAKAMRMAIPSFFWKLPSRAVDAVFGLMAQRSVAASYFFDNAKEAFGIASPSQFLRAWEPYNLWSVKDKLSAPLLILLSEDELAEAPRAVLEDTLAFLDGLKAPLSVRIFSRAEGAAAHCQLDSPERAPPVLFPWLNRIFSTATPMDDEIERDAEGFAKLALLVEKYHGTAFAASLRRIQERNRSAL